MTYTLPDPAENREWLISQIHRAIDEMNDAIRHDDSAHAEWWRRRWKRLTQALAALPEP